MDYRGTEDTSLLLAPFCLPPFLPRILPRQMVCHFSSGLTCYITLRTELSSARSTPSFPPRPPFGLVIQKDRGLVGTSRILMTETMSTGYNGYFGGALLERQSG